jgi:NADP-dependent aldehyde dehydrogenase
MIQGYNPRTGEPAGEPVAETTDAEVDAIAGAAASALDGWEGMGPDSRAAALEAVAGALDGARDELVPLADTETALGVPRLTGELARATGQLRMFAGVLREGEFLDRAISPAGDGAPDLRRISRAIGPVAVFAASNFPFAFSVAGGDTASALAAGCPVVVKAHEAHPRVSAATARVVTGALAAAGAPAGTFGIVYGVAAGPRLLRHPAICAAGFTGSAAGGSALARICAERPAPIPFHGEYGSVNPVVILPGAAAARPAEIASGYAASLTLGTGQYCTNPGLVFGPRSEPLLEAIAAEIRSAAGGAMLSQRIHAAFTAAVGELAGDPSVRLLGAGKPGEGPWAGTPQVFTVGLEDFTAGLPGIARERFGPAGLLVTYRQVTDVPPVLARLGGNLAGVIHLDPSSSGDLASARQVLRVLRRSAGRIVFNGWPTGVAVTAAQHHGGPWPATSDPAHTSVGTAAIRRWLVPVAYQDCPPELLPDSLRSAS